MYTEHSNTQTKTIDITTVTYTCSSPGCEFSDSDREELVRHFGKEHAIKEHRVIGDDSFCRLEAEEDFDAWRSHVAYSCDLSEFEWRGPGWYTTKYYRQPCGRGCCTDSGVRSLFLDEVIEHLSSDIKEKQEQLESLCTLQEG